MKQCDLTLAHRMNSLEALYCLLNVVVTLRVFFPKKGWCREWIRWIISHSAYGKFVDRIPLNCSISIAHSPRSMARYFLLQAWLSQPGNPSGRFGRGALKSSNGFRMIRSHAQNLITRRRRPQALGVLHPVHFKGW